ncbi:MAG: transcription termination/antitermination NusG family protein, partial [Gammaproteobacteria bacterium]
GYSVYLPLAQILRRRRGRAIPDIGPLFPRYLFIHLSDETDNWKPIRSTLGVQQLVRFGERPASVPNALIEVLRSREDGSGLQPLPSAEPVLGETVRINQGPFEGYTAIFHARTSSERVILLLKLAENSIRLEADSMAIERL